jgi:hypothetical protein
MRTPPASDRALAFQHPVPITRLVKQQRCDTMTNLSTQRMVANGELAEPGDG